MPTHPAPSPVPDPVDSAQPYYVRDLQSWAVDQERQRHGQALLVVGEYAMFCLLWHIQDFEAGLVGRCPMCFLSGSDVEQAIAAVYAQPTQNRCPVCFGTTFEDGWKALIIRPAIFSDTDESETFTARGVVHPNNVDIESTTDFRVRTGDYAFRGNGERYQLGVPARITLRTGFGPPHQSSAAIGYNHASASFEDPDSSVAYDIGPSAEELSTLLTRGQYLPEIFADAEVIRAPLIPVGE